jgi:hypothetical protein
MPLIGWTINLIPRLKQAASQLVAATAAIARHPEKRAVESGYHKRCHLIKHWSFIVVEESP